MKKFDEKRIKRKEEEHENLENLLSDYKSRLLITNDPGEIKGIEIKIESIKKQRTELETELEALYEKQSNYQAPVPTTIASTTPSTLTEKAPKSDLETALQLLKQKEAAAYSKGVVSKQEAEEILKLKEEARKEFDKLLPSTQLPPKAVLTTLSVLFERIAFSTDKLPKTILEEIGTIRDEKAKNNAWVDRSLVVTALTLRIIGNKKINSNDWNLLIDFLTDFEEKVWQRALCGLVLAFQFRQNKIGRFDKILKRLKKLRTTPDVQEGLNTIDFILLNQTYKGGFAGAQLYQQAFFEEQAMHYFLPYYEQGNPIVEEALENDEEGAVDHAELLDVFEHVPLPNALKYLILQNLNNVKVERLEQKKSLSERPLLSMNMLNMSMALHPFQNIIQEYYSFAKFSPKNTAQDLFKQQQSIANTKLKDIILAEKEKAYLSARAAYKDKKYTTAIKYAKQGLKLDVSNLQLLGLLADIYLHKEDYAAAIVYLKQQLAITPDGIRILTRLGDCYFKQENYALALDYYEQVIAIELPDDSNFWNDKGVTHGELQQYHKALENFDKAIEINPKEAKIWSNRGVIYADLKKFDKALNDYNKAIELNPNKASFWYNRGNTYHKLKKFDKALNDYNKAIEINPNEADCWYNRGITYHKLKKYDKALNDYNKAIEINPNKAIFWNNRGITYKKLKKYDKALNDYNKAIELNPNEADSWHNLAYLHFQLNRTEESQTNLHKALAIEREWNFVGLLGHLAFQANQLEEALSHYKEAVDICKDWEAFEAAYKEDAEHIENLQLEVHQYLSILETLRAYWQDKQS